MIDGSKNAIRPGDVLPPVARPPAAPRAQAPPLDPEDLISLQKSASQPSVLGKVRSKLGAWTGKVASFARAAAAVVPTLASLVAARELARVEGLVAGKSRTSALDWLRKRTPRLFSSNLGKLLKWASGPTERAVGLSLDDLLTVEEHFYRMLSPVTGKDGVKTSPAYLKDLAAAPFRGEGAPHAAYVYLGDGREQDSKHIMDLWNGPEPPGENPFPEEDDRSFVWEVLQKKADKAELPVFVDLDGDARTFTPTEFLAKETLASLVDRSNSLGDSFKDAGLYYSWQNTRLDTYHRSLDPWFKQHKPQIHGQLQAIKQDLTPPWLAWKVLRPALS